MEKYSENNVGQIRELTSKEKVLEIYPLADLVNFGDRFEVWVAEEIRLRPFTSIKAINECQAWEAAWQSIQQKMLQKLEQ